MMTCLSVKTHEPQTEQEGYLYTGVHHDVLQTEGAA